MLRNIPNVEFGMVRGYELPLWYHSTMPIASNIEHINLGPLLEAKFQSLVQGNSKVVHLWKMYESLLAYAQTFERNLDWKEDMNPGYGQARKRLDPPPEAHPAFARKYPESEYRVFKVGQVVHPVEDALEHASFASETGDKEKFKVARQQILKYIEPQYRRIVASSDEIVAFIKVHKKVEGLLDAGFENNQIFEPSDDELARALVLLEDYTTSFKRDLTIKTRMVIALEPRTWELAYLMSNREENLTRLRQLLVRGSRANEIEFLQLFRDCASELDEQYLEIREARKTLFRDEPATTTRVMGMSLDEWAQPWRCDEKIDWDTNEPEFGPWKDPNAEPPYDSDLESVADSIEFSAEEESSDSDSDGEF